MPLPRVVQPQDVGGADLCGGDAFTEEVYDHGILQDLDPSHVVQILANICYHADGGVPTNSIVGLYINGYALSEKMRSGWSALPKVSATNAARSPPCESLECIPGIVAGLIAAYAEVRRRG